MLRSITVHNIAIVQHLHLDLRKGLTTLTGETGAGKSLLLDAIIFALGGKADTSLIRLEAEEATVSLVFDEEQSSSCLEYLKSLGLSFEDCVLVIRRSMTKNGKTRNFINDQPISATVLRSIGDFLIEIHGQFDRLLNSAQHRSTLDYFGNLSVLAGQVSQSYREWKDFEDKIKSIKSEIQTAQENREFREFCLFELKKADPKKGEEEILLELKTQLSQKEKDKEIFENILQELRQKQKIEQALNAAYRILSLNKKEPIYTIYLEKLDAITAHVEEFIEMLEQKLAEERDETLSLEDIEQRVHTLRALAKKHGCTVDDLPSVMERFQEEGKTERESTQKLQKWEEQAVFSRLSYEKKAHLLTQKRQESSIILQEKVERELLPLKLKAHFIVQMTPLNESQWSEHGMETVEFYVATNTGERAGPLSKIASGGEMARLMLAIKVVLNQNDQVPTLIFDEIDTGVGGAVADAMGQKLRALAQNTQVLVVTHSPQVAAYGDELYHVSKVLHEERVQTKIHHLHSDEEKIEELARMLSGSSITPQARAAAEQLLKNRIL